jgi:hypothetical protein
MHNVTTNSLVMVPGATFLKTMTWVFKVLFVVLVLVVILAALAGFSSVLDQMR